MIVLDEQLMGRGVELAIKHAYRGKVCFVTDLRPPNTVIKDENIPVLLEENSDSTFVTINIKDFWERVAIGDRFCVVCLDMPDSQVAQIPNLLRRLFLRTEFKTKRARCGKVVKIVNGMAIYYTRADQTHRTVAL